MTTPTDEITDTQTRTDLRELFPPIPVPDVVMIDGLRQQVSVLNDEVVRLRIDLDFKNQLVASLQAIIAGQGAEIAHSHHEHDHDQPHTHVHEEFDH